ncbi:unnamed protein product [Camellia sinensis]
MYLDATRSAMPKMKHLLRKLHIGGGCNNGNHHLSPPQTAEVTPPSSSSSASLESALMRIRAVESAENPVDFNFFEEEFQVQLALAISVSDPDSREEPETVQIKDAKQISSGCVPSETLTESLSSVPMDHTNSKIGTNAPPSSTPNWTINISDVRTVKVSNISLATSEKDIKEFFSFSGDIQYVEMQRETETSQLAYVTFKESQGADTAMLLTGLDMDPQLLIFQSLVHGLRITSCLLCSSPNPLVICYRKVPSEEQIKDLLRKKNFEEAISLVEELQSEGEMTKEMLSFVHAQVGFLLLFDLHFEEAVNHFLLSETM